MIEYDPPVYRPPGEWRSFLVQATIGCSHNGCTFCGMYKGKKFRIRPMDDIIGDIREAVWRFIISMRRSFSATATPLL